MFPWASGSHETETEPDVIKCNQIHRSYGCKFDHMAIWRFNAEREKDAACLIPLDYCTSRSIIPNLSSFRVECRWIVKMAQQK